MDEEKKISISEFVANFRAGKYNDPDIATQIEAGWYDWFCSDRLLVKKTFELGKKIEEILDSPLFDPDNCYVFFKNNALIDGTTYDQFSIVEMGGDRKPLFVVQEPNSRFRAWAVYGKENNYSQALAMGTWTDIRNWFLQKK